MTSGTEARPIWQIPEYETYEFFERRTPYCVCIPVINEGQRLLRQLDRMAKLMSAADVIVADGGSTDGSTDPDVLASTGVRALLRKKGKGRLGAQLRMAFAYALAQGYRGVVTVDGNDKDGVEAIPRFINALEEGYDFVQGSRYVSGGQGINTPLVRHLAVKLIHAPTIAFLAGFPYTDTTNGFRAYSGRLLSDAKLGIFRDVFDHYEILAYVSVKAPRLGYKVKEIPVVRAYPEKGRIPTKISPFRGSLYLMRVLVDLALGRYD